MEVSYDLLHELVHRAGRYFPEDDPDAMSAYYEASNLLYKHETEVLHGGK
jgi:hypothetical protein